MADRALLDTNILVYALYDHSPQHHPSRALLTRRPGPRRGPVRSRSIDGGVLRRRHQPRRVTPAKDHAEALAAIDALLTLPGLALLPTPPDLVSRWMRLLRHHPVTAHHIFDVQLMATMLANGIRRIITFNRDDFLGYPDIEPIRPSPPSPATLAST